MPLPKTQTYSAQDDRNLPDGKQAELKIKKDPCHPPSAYSAAADEADVL